MDELQISGKRYISSKRAAQQRGYHADYIGQLIRGGKVTGQKVGRAWYVEIASLDAYLGAAPAEEIQAATPEKEISKKSLPAAAEEIKEEIVQEKETATLDQEIKQSSVTRIEPEIVEEKISAKEPVVLEEAREVPVHVEPAFVEEKMKKEISIPIKKGGLTYLHDDAPLMPILEQKNFSMVSAPAGELYISKIIPTRPKGNIWKSVAGLAFLSIVSFSISFGLASATGNNLVLAGERVVSAVVFSLPDTFAN